MITDTITTVIEMIPTILSKIREFVISITTKLNFPSDSYMLAFLAISLILSYYWIKQWITYSVFTKISTILNWILLATILYILFVYI